MLVFQQHIFHIGYFTPVILSFAPIFPSDTHPRKGKIIKETKYLTLPRDCCPNQGHWFNNGLNCANLPFLRYLCSLAYSGVQHILCCILLCFSSSCVPYDASFSGLSFFIVHSVFSNIYLSCVLLPVSLNSPFLFSLRLSLTFITNTPTQRKNNKMNQISYTSSIFLFQPKRKLIRMKKYI
jgi:hypothetical protein